MAARYLTALDYSDWHTHNVLRKHAKNRPLGRLECRYQYKQQQPLLSCRTVETDASSVGEARAYVKSGGQRAVSACGMLQEQQKVLKQILANGGRAVTSAPSRRSPSRRGGEQTTGDNSNAEAMKRGRPSTSLSISSGSSRSKSTASSCRFKSTGRPKSSSSTSSESFKVLRVDKEMMRTRRTHSYLTNQIHAHWRPGSSNLNQGHYRRGQKTPDDVPMAPDDWLTFGGAATNKGGTEGVIDAFANFSNPETYYNIGGSVGSRVAQQLRKGGRIRIGINGEVVSHNLRIKKWGQGVEDPDEEPMAPREEVLQERERVEEEEEKLEGDPDESVQENPPSPASPDTEQEEEFGDLVVESFVHLTPSPTEEREESTKALAHSLGRHSPAGSKTPFVDFPLNWDDQVSRPEVKVISARRPPADNNRENLCETHPVVFNPRTRHPHGRPRLASSSSAHGYRIKQRPVSSSNSNRNSNIANSTAAVRHRLDSASGNKVRAITIDQNSEEEDQRLKELSIEDVIQTRLEIAASSPTPGRWRARSSLSASHHPEGHRHPGWMMTAGHGEPGRCSSSMAALPPGRWPSARGNDSPGSPRGKRSPTDRDGRRSTSPGGTKSAPCPPGDRRLGVPRPSSSVPFQGTRDVRDLGTFRPAVLSSRGSGSKAGRHGSEKGPRPMTGLPVYRGPGSGGVSSINAGSMPGDARFIKISQPIRNPNASPVALVSGLRSYYSPFPVNSVAASPAPPPLHHFPPCSPPRSNTPESMLDMEDDPERTAEGSILAALSRSLTPSVHEEGVLGEVEEQEPTPEESRPSTGIARGGVAKVEESSVESKTVSSGISDPALPAAPAPVHVIQAINIPTGGEMEEEEEEEVDEALKGDRGAGDQVDQVDQVAHLLVKAVLAESRVSPLNSFDQDHVAHLLVNAVLPAEHD